MRVLRLEVGDLVRWRQTGGTNAGRVGIVVKYHRLGGGWTIQFQDGQRSIEPGHMFEVINESR